MIRPLELAVGMTDPRAISSNVDGVALPAHGSSVLVRDILETPIFGRWLA
jgi:hypothetical protein